MIINIYNYEYKKFDGYNQKLSVGMSDFSVKYLFWNICRNNLWRSIYFRQQESPVSYIFLPVSKPFFFLNRDCLYDYVFVPSNQTFYLSTDISSIHELSGNVLMLCCRKRFYSARTKYNPTKLRL